MNLSKFTILILHVIGVGGVNISESAINIQNQLTMLDIHPHIPPTNSFGWVGIGAQTYYSSLGYANDKTNEVSLSAFFIFTWSLLNSSPKLNNTITLSKAVDQIWLPKFSIVNGNSQSGKLETILLLCFEI